MTKRILLVAAAALAAVSMLVAEADLTGAKCPIAGAQAAKGLAVDYKGGKVHFCCAGCPEAFKANPKAHAVKANHQLFVTGQAKQTACPLTGSALSKGNDLKLDGKTVEFCCPSCRDSVDAADGDKKLEMLFSDEAFDKSFKVGD
jgi:YHS domain-containing protein